MPKANQKVKLTLNIGAKDKKRLGLEDVEAREGQIVSVTEDAAAILKENGWAVESNAELPQLAGSPPEPAVPAVDTTESKDGGPAKKGSRG